MAPGPRAAVLLFDMDRLRIASTGRALNYLPHYVAANLGIFKSFGLDVSERAYDPWTGAVAALEARHADAVLGGIWAPLMYRRIGRDYVSFAQVTGACPLVLVARGIKQEFTWRDMDGAVVMVPGGGHCAGFLALASHMRAHGYDIARTRPLHDLSEPLCIELFEGGIGEFLVAPRLPSLRLTAEIGGTIVASLAATGGKMPWSVYYTRRPVLRERLAVLRRFRSAIEAAMDWLSARPAAEAVKMIADMWALDEPRICEAVATYKKEGIWDGADIRAPALDRWQATLVQHGILAARSSYDDVVIQ